jgi:hypothetical protein
MGRSVIIDDEYYADQDHEKAPWVIRNGQDVVVGYYSDKGITWNEAMDELDKTWLPDVLKLKLA